MDISGSTNQSQNRKRVIKISSRGKRVADDNGAKEAASKRQWSAIEDQKLVECLLELCMDGRFKNEAGFKPGYLKELERMMAERLPGCDLKATPHIDSRYRLLKRQYGAISEMLGPHGSGFGWNDQEKYVDCTEDVFKEWVKSHPNAKGLRKKPFPHYEDFTIIWGKDRATGEHAEGPADVCEDIELDDIAIDEFNTISKDTPVHVEETVYGDDMGFGRPSNSEDVETSNGSSKGRKRSKSELTEQLVGNIEKLTSMYEATNNSVARLANSFDHEAVEAARMEKVMEEIMQMGQFTRSEKTRAAELIISNPTKMIIFFRLDPNDRADYVAEQL